MSHSAEDIAKSGLSSIRTGRSLKVKYIAAAVSQVLISLTSLREKVPWYKRILDGHLTRLRALIRTLARKKLQQRLRIA